MRNILYQNESAVVLPYEKHHFRYNSTTIIETNAEYYFADFNVQNTSLGRFGA